MKRKKFPNLQKTLKVEIQNIIKKIVKDYQPEKIILFGSCAYGEPDDDSDIDLLKNDR